MTLISKGYYRARFAEGQDDLDASRRLRAEVFCKASDADAFDETYRHVLIEDVNSEELVCSFRFLHVAPKEEISRCYSAQFYGLDALSDAGEKLEVGRFCVAPSSNDPSVLRVAWSVITRYVDDHGIDLLFGCSSFEGLDPAPYKDAFALLNDRYLAPIDLRPKQKATEVYGFSNDLNAVKPDVKVAQKTMPPLLKTYLTMGGWVSDHAVIDRQMNTLHVFTGVEIAKIPTNRKRLLRADAN